MVSDGAGTHRPVPPIEATMTVTNAKDRAARLRKEADSLPEPTALALHPFEEVAVAA